jgi:hypothetical protein
VPGARADKSGEADPAQRPVASASVERKQAVAIGVEPPPAPRPISGTARRRAWAEPRARAWLLSGLVLLLIAIGCLIQESSSWRASESILNKNTPVSAVITVIDGTDRQGFAASAAEASCRFSFTYNGHPYTVDGSIADQADESGMAVVGRTVTLHIDPADPEHRWTAVTGTTTLGLQLVGFWVTLPVSLLLLALAYWQRTRVLGIWVNGHDTPCVVVNTSQSALAPLSIAVQCTPVTGFERHVATVLVPRRIATPRAGDEIWIVFPRDKIESAIAAVCFDAPDRAAAAAPSPAPSPANPTPGPSA